MFHLFADTEQPINDSKQALNFAKISSSEIEDSYSLDDEDSISDITIDDKILEVDDTGHVILTTDCQMLAPCVVVPGSLTITSTAMFFSADEDDEEYRKIDPKVSCYPLSRRTVLSINHNFDKLFLGSAFP